MNNKWPELSLMDVCSRITDGAHNSPKSVEVGLPMASVKDLTRFGINYQTCRHISVDDYEKLARQGNRPIAGDVLIAKDGATALDTVCYLKENPNVVLLSSVAILRPDASKISSQYLRYYLDCKRTRDYMKSNFITGAAIPRVVLEDFKRVRIKSAHSVCSKHNCLHPLRLRRPHRKQHAPHPDSGADRTDALPRVVCPLPLSRS